MYIARHRLRGCRGLHWGDVAGSWRAVLGRGGGESAGGAVVRTVSWGLVVAALRAVLRRRGVSAGSCATWRDVAGSRRAVLGRGGVEAQGVGVAVATLESQRGFPCCGGVGRGGGFAVPITCAVLAGLVHGGPRWAVAGTCRGVVADLRSGRWRGLCTMDRGGDHGAESRHGGARHVAVVLRWWWSGVLESREIGVAVTAPGLSVFEVKREQKKEKKKELNEAVVATSVQGESACTHERTAVGVVRVQRQGRGLQLRPWWLGGRRRSGDEGGGRRGATVLVSVLVGVGVAAVVVSVPVQQMSRHGPATVRGEERTEKEKRKELNEAVTATSVQGESRGGGPPATAGVRVAVEAMVVRRAASEWRRGWWAAWSVAV
ncbi:hypothetical protein EDB85DRAFT_2279787 [Lactarius pseudohatsudake]|nr:hypothetical protein EDB85DRAFT_2279787 [Lactarius pseudohatsudake]